MPDFLFDQGKNKIEGSPKTKINEIDEELQNIRIGADGKTYSTAGAAVRGQIKYLDSKNSNYDKLIANETLITSNNLVVTNEIVDGLLQSNGSVGENASYRTTGFIPVNINDVFKSNFSLMRSACYDENKQFIAGSFDTTTTKEKTVSINASFIRFSYLKRNDTALCIIKNIDEFIAEPYFEPFYRFENEQKVYQKTHFYTNVFNYNDYNEETTNYKYYILPLQPKQKFYIFNGIVSRTIRMVEYYNMYDYRVSYANYPSTIEQSGVASYCKLTVENDARITNIMITDEPEPLKFAEFGQEILRNEMLPIDVSPVLDFYVPPEIPVGIGRTIELYNELVLLENSKYHIQYSCSIGVQFERKFSIIGTTAGEYPLTVRIYDDDLHEIAYKTSIVKVVQNTISSVKNIIPIGDSLTNLKPWLSEVETLSNNKIKFIGTRGRNDSSIRHEGRSGISAIDMNEQFNYTFDNNYQGNPNVLGTINPFFDTVNNKFSLSYYLNNQETTIGTPDAIQIFLGTNDIAIDPTNNVSSIVEMVDTIRNEFETLPIFVCNTIYRSNQNGYYSMGGDNYHAASDWQFDADKKIMNLQTALFEALQNYENVFIIPLSVCMDRQYNYGNVAVPVNPRLESVTVNIPNESVHPQNSGYMQMADVIYSSYIAHLT